MAGVVSPLPLGRGGDFGAFRSSHVVRIGRVVSRARSESCPRRRLSTARNGVRRVVHCVRGCFFLEGARIAIVCLPPSRWRYGETDKRDKSCIYALLP